MKKMHQKPPLLAKWFFLRMTRYEESYSITRDVDEVFSSLCGTHGRLRAVLWYWYQCIVSGSKYFILPLKWSTPMLKNYMKTALRNIGRHKVYYLLNILGLGFGMAFFVLTLVYTSFESGYDRFHENAKRIFCVVKVNTAANDQPVHSAILPPPMLPAMAEAFPEIEKSTRYMWDGRKIVRSGEKILYEDGIWYVDPDFLSMFSFEMIDGNPLTALSEPFSAVVSKETAIKYFGHANPVGKTLSVDHQTDVIVHGVIDEPPENSSIDCNILISFNTLLPQQADMESWEAEECMIMLQLDKKDSQERLNNKLPDFVSRHYPADNHFCKQLYLHPLTAFHFNGLHIDSFLNSRLKTGNTFFFVISIVLLIIACFNFINLATAKSMTRLQEIGVRSVVGANRWQLIEQSLIETILVALLSVPVAVLIYELFLHPYFTQMTGAPASSFSLIHNGDALLKILLASLVLGLFAGFYPAVTASRMKVTQILKRNTRQGTGGTRIRKVLIVSQFVVSIMVIIMTFMFGEQREYLLNMDLGYDRENVIVLNASSGVVSGYDAFREKVLKYENIVSVSASRGLVARWNPVNQVIPEGNNANETIAMNTYGVNTDFIESFKLQVLHGRGFSRHFQDENNIVINEKALEALKWEDPIGKTLEFGDRKRTIVGVVKDFNFKELFWDIIPTFLYIEPVNLNFFYIRVSNPENPSTLNRIRASWDECFPDHPFVQSLLVDQFIQQNLAVYTTQSVFALISFITGFYALFGMIGLSIYSLLRRSKEIGIRKVFGASSGRILKTLYSEYIFLVGLACLIATPVTYFLTEKIMDVAWTSAVPMKLEVFAFVYFFVLLTVTFSVLFQTLKAANKNPVETLKYE